MKYPFAVLVAILIAATSANASSVADLAKANCVKQIMACASQVDRN